MSNMPKLRFQEFEGEWQAGKISNLLDQIIDYRGQSVPKAAEGIPLITARNVKSGYLDFTEQEFIAEADYTTWMTRGIPRQGDVLFTTEAPLGNVAAFPSTGRYAVGQRTVTLRANPKKISSDFLKYFLLSDVGQQRIDRYSSGSTAKGIKSAELKKVLIDHPSLPEQQKIASFLSTVDEKISLLQRKLELLQTYKRGVMQKLFSQEIRFKQADGSSFPDWEEKRLGEILEVERGGSPRPIQTFITKEKHGIPWIKIGDIRISARFIESTAEKIKPEGVYKSREIFPGDFVLSNSMSFGRPYISKIYGCIHDGWLVLRNTKKAVSSEYLYEALSSDDIKRKFLAAAAGSAVKNLKSETVKNVFLDIPALSEQQKIASFLSSIDQKIDALNQQISLTEQFKKGLFQQMFV